MGLGRVSSLTLFAGALLALSTDLPVRAQPALGGANAGGHESPIAPITTSSTLTELCDESGNSAHYAEALSGSGVSMERNVVSLTGCPNHVNWAINPNSAREIPSDTVIPAYPSLMTEDLTDLSSTSGAVGILLNGVSIFSSWALGTAEDYGTSALAIEGDTFDLCGGHSTTEGWYHYHNTPGCVQEQAMVAAGTTAADHTPQLGWAYDGFPIYGQLGPNGVEMKMCGEDGADETYCLDGCSGYEGTLEGVDEFKYRYYSSCGFDDSYFPFTTNCYRGCCPEGMSCSSQVEVCPPEVEDGYTANYIPEVTESLSEAYETVLIAGEDNFVIDTLFSLDCSLYAGSVAGKAILGAATGEAILADGDPTPAPSVDEPNDGFLDSSTLESQAGDDDNSETVATTDDEPGESTFSSSTPNATPPPNGEVPTASPATEDIEEDTTSAGSAVTASGIAALMATFVVAAATLV